MRDVTIDEVFTWREEFGVKAKEAFESQYVDVSPQTYSDLKQRCDRLEREVDRRISEAYNRGLRNNRQADKTNSRKSSHKD